MKRILHLISSIQGNESYSYKLSNAIVNKVIEKYPGSTVEEVNLNNLDIPHLTPLILQSMFTPADQLTPEAKASIRYSDEAVKQLMATDILVIGAPLYNLTIPTTLKAWGDHITRAGITFGYSENGPVGMVKGKKVYIAMSSGGVYSEGPSKPNDFVAPYLKSFLGLLGMTDVTVFRVEGVKLPGIKEHALEKGIASIHID
ncbi:FMN-dependent NADH-azoreductase [Chitinophaga pinensis]|uniref:FMN dependent NADH:quinone oxidoreductase n=1 Tax=Chitinophaga pinensis (strain ATCC 43595 / DSM 2588 / LMG 13176 / NBRC 15968 / NCIMB 11800 / UQM 2034) TaxID=485918 RepID=A0A979G3N1_CHIPD|nr:NAD(P)H-dependent oxidoreductase [Chitinophaga pinensis]ACU60189.1 NAD(P)H dehydrogenase (quinone) [Chitinophaga pinensis DSM 2588]